MLFALKDRTDPDGEVLAVVSYHEADDGFLIDLPPGADPWAEPLVLSSFAERGVRTVGPEWSKRWVRSRLVPPSRQNLGEVLKVNGLERYDEAALLAMTGGENSQDDCYVEPLGLDAAPRWYAQRYAERLSDVIPLDGGRLFLMFADGAAGVCHLADLTRDYPLLARVVADEGAAAGAGTAYGGRMACWGTTVTVPAEALRDACERIPLTRADMGRLAAAALVDASQAADLLGCSRQNVGAMARRGTLEPVKTGPKSTLFMRADILERLS